MCVLLFIAAIVLPLVVVTIIGSYGGDIIGPMILGLYMEVAFVSAVLLWYIRDQRKK